MIPFASQRAGGQDLATHLSNALDNEYVEIAQIRGAVARDLHGAFAEWEAQASALTRCRQYLCSLSINPDEWQGRLTRAQHLDYIERAEAKLGLTGQPRAVIFHIKEDKFGRPREHCHVVWSRVDAQAGKARQLSFFKEKLMTITREFARDHGLDLPEGYRRHEEKVLRRNRQLSAYDCIKQKKTGITHEQRMAAVTDAWRRSDSGPAFVNALEELGYVLATGRNGTRPVVVDIYGHSTALQRLIDDPAVKTKHIREFLGPDYAPENLPTVDEAQALAAQHRKAIEAFEKVRLETEQDERLRAQQEARRRETEAEGAQLVERQRQERAQLAAQHAAARRQLRAEYLAERRRIRIERARNAPKGVAAFLGRVTGVALIIRKIRRYRDKQRLDAHRASKRQLAGQQRTDQQMLARRHELQTADMDRKLRALKQIEERERKSLEQARTRERRQRINSRHEHMPTFGLELKPPGRKAAPHKAKNRFISPVRQELLEVANEQRPARPKKIKLVAEFERAAQDDTRTGGESGGDSDAPKPAAEPKLAPELAKAAKADKPRTKIRLAREFAKVAREEGGEGEAGGASGAPRPAAEPKIERQQRKIDLPREFNEAAANPYDTGGGDGPRPDPPDDGPDDRGPKPDRPRPRRTRKRDLDRGR